MSTLNCSVPVYQEIESAVTTLRKLCPDSPVVSWWNDDGQYLSYAISSATMPDKEQSAVCENIKYIRRVLTHALKEPNVDDLEEVVTRLVSDVEETRSYWGSAHG